MSSTHVALVQDRPPAPSYYLGGKGKNNRKTYAQIMETILLLFAAFEKQN